MADTATVLSDDIRTVTAVLGIAATAFGSYLGAVPGFGAALEACGRLSAAAEQTAMPEDPVGGLDQTAIGHHEAMMAYERAGFERPEAFTIILEFIQANASAVALRGLAHG